MYRGAARRLNIRPSLPRPHGRRSGDGRGAMPDYSPINVTNNLKRSIYALLVAKTGPLSKMGGMITPRQIRAARALLDWSQQKLADKAIVSVNAVIRLENETADTRLSTLSAIHKTLTKAGVDFLPEGQWGEGVRLRKPGK